MARLFRFIVWLVARAVLSLRYRIRLHGTESVRHLRPPILILPNHIGYIEPIILFTMLWPVFRARPLLWEGVFLNPVFYPLLKLIRAVRIPEVKRASADARARTEQGIAEVIAGLRRGENYIVWPSGRAQRDGTERLGAARAAADILRAVPEAQIVLVRTWGLWGSSFSYAYTGQTPPLVQRLRQGVLLVLANLLLFMPRRRVAITMEAVDRQRLPDLRRETLNPWLEQWYNQDGPETPTFVPYHFLLGPRSHDFPRPSSRDELDWSQIKPATQEAVNEIIAHKLGRPFSGDETQPATRFDQLGLDSLDRTELTLTVEQQFGVTSDQIPENLGQLYALAQGLVEREPPKPAPAAWFQPLSSTGLVEALGNTIAEAFVNRALAQRRDVIVADDFAGPLTYGRLLIGVTVLARRFAELPGEHVGLMLPASVAADTSYIALLLADKVPVLLNWTTGPIHLGHAAQLMKLSHVITSRAFIDRTAIQVEGVHYLFLEDLRKRIGKVELLWTLLQVRWLPGRIRRNVPPVDPQKPAMILFTSGSERAPKAVPLTHANILSELRATAPHVGLTQQESILGFLPPFHSFGIAASVLLPLLGGMRVLHHPDPTDASRLARKITVYRATMLIGTPTFVSYILDRAGPGDLDSLHMIVVGAEKCPSVLYERARQLAPSAAVLEGYGVTECSPVVAVNRPGANRPGTVGQPLPCLAICTVDVETEQPLPAGQRGMLWVSGPTVFPGYLGYDGPSPFRERDGKRWYVTGDLAEIDADGFIRLAGRLQRFLKAGGEMISLPALEEPFGRRFPPTEDGPRVAVEGMETDSGRRIALFTTEPLTLAEANAILQQEGFRGVLRLDEVWRVEKLPVLGTGKVDYKVLREQLASSAGTG
jgi:acyl-CoA synthetase (AMP-forming)/AMP-acid ligase II/1-acyl-sn-glycerol-3-phosphate acyltransferase/acyl carrier protein